MRNIPLATVLAAVMTVLVARPAAAQLQAAVVGWMPVPAPPVQSPATAPAPTPPPETAAPAPVEGLTRQAPAEDPRLRQWQEAAFAYEAASMSGGRITVGGAPMKAGQFYALVGRPDLNAQIQNRRIGKGIAMGAGIGVAAFGTAWGVLDATAASLHNGVGRAVNLCDFSQDRATDPDCVKRETTPLPWMLALAGGAVAVSGATIKTDPLTREQKTELVNDYNRRLRARIGLSSAVEAARRTATVQAAVQPDGRSGMLTAGCAF